MFIWMPLLSSQHTGLLVNPVTVCGEYAESGEHCSVSWLCPSYALLSLLWLQISPEVSFDDVRRISSVVGLVHLSFCSPFHFCDEFQFLWLTGR